MAAVGSKAVLFRHLRMFLVAQVWAHLMFVPRFAVVCIARNRYLLFWNEMAGLVLIGCAVGVGCILYVLGVILASRSRKWFERLSVLCGIWVLVSIFSGMLQRGLGKIGLSNTYFISALCWVCLMLLAVVLTIRRKWAWEYWQHLLSKGSLFFVLLLPMLWYDSLAGSAFPQPAAELSLSPQQSENGGIARAGAGTPRVPPAHPAAAGKAAPGHGEGRPAKAENVYIFVFDEWAYRLSFDSNGPRDEYPGLGAASREMTWFARAYSPGNETYHSMPRFICQLDDEFQVRGDTLGFVAADGGEFRPAADLPNLFSYARERGYRTYLIGWYHNYSAMLGQSVDHCTTRSCRRLFAPTCAGRAADSCLGAALDVISCYPMEYVLKLHAVRVNVTFIRRANWIEAQLRTVLAEGGHGQFMLVHHTVPHYPFCFAADGSTSWHFHPNNRDEPGMRRHLEYTDGLITGILNALREQGKYQDSLIVLTSDHNWRVDPKRDPQDDADRRRIPLLIKFPRQQKQHVIRQRVSTVRLLELLDLAAESDYDPSRLEEAIGGDRLYENLEQ